MVTVAGGEAGLVYQAHVGRSLQVVVGVETKGARQTCHRNAMYVPLGTVCLVGLWHTRVRGHVIDTPGIRVKSSSKFSPKGLPGSTN